MGADQDVSAALLAEMRAVHAKVDALTEELQQALRRLLTREDQRELRRLLPLIRALQGDQVWSASSLFADALDDHGAEELRVMLFDWVGAQGGGLRSLGRFLERCTGTSSAGLRLVRVGRPNTGTLYLVQPASRSQARGPASQPRASTVSKC